jgi:arginyl-tRNA synthetase
MSKRTGNFIFIDDLIAEVGSDATRFYFLRYNAESHMNFDLKQAQEKSEKNPVYYVQYAYARICNILKQKEIGKIPKRTSLQFTENSEYNLIKELIKMPDLIMAVATNYQIQGLTAFAVNLADKSHQFYTNCRVINNGQVNWPRVKLVQATQIILKSLFDILGISAPEKM